MINNRLVKTIEKILEDGQLAQTFLTSESLEDTYIFLRKFDDSITIKELQNLLNKLSEVIHSDMHAIQLNDDELEEIAGGNNMGTNIKKFTGTSLAALLILGPVADTALLAAPADIAETSSISRKSSSNAEQVNGISKKIMNYLVGGTIVAGAVIAAIVYNREEQFTPEENQLIERLSQKTRGHIKPLPEYNHKQFTERENQWIQLLSGNTVQGNTKFQFKNYEEFRHATPGKLEGFHRFVQLFFPTRTQSRHANQDLYLNLKLPIWQAFFRDHQNIHRAIQENMYVNFIRMLQFWKFKITLDENDQLTSIEVDPSRPQVFEEYGNHNKQRATRVLNSLRLFGLDDESKMLLDSLIKRYPNHPSRSQWERTQHTTTLI